MSDYTRVTWYEHDCDWITKYCDDHHTRSALISTAALAVLGDRDALREKIAEAVRAIKPDPYGVRKVPVVVDAVLDVLYGEEKDV